MDNEAGIITFNMPEGYDKIIDYAEKNRQDFDAILKLAPANREEIKKALYGFLNNCKFENCRINKGYVKALVMDK